MAIATSYQDVLFVQGPTTSATLDMSQPGRSVPKRVSDYIGFSVLSAWSGSPNGTLQLQLSNASVQSDNLVEPANYVTISPLTLTIGSGATPATSPALMEMTFGRSGWVSLLWTPTGGTGSLSAKFEGVRR